MYPFDLPFDLIALSRGVRDTDLATPDTHDASSRFLPPPLQQEVSAALLTLLSARRNGGEKRRLLLLLLLLTGDQAPAWI